MSHLLVTYLKVWHGSIVNMTWLNCKCDMPCMMRQMYKWVMSYLQLSNGTLSDESRVNVTWRLHMHDMGGMYMCIHTGMDDVADVYAAFMCTSHVIFTNDSCHIFKWVTCKWVMSQIQISHATHTWAVADVYVAFMCTSHVTFTNEWCHTFRWVMSLFQLSLVTITNEWSHTFKWVLSHLQMSNVTFTNESCHSHRWVMSNFQMSHITVTNESRHVNKWTNESCHSYKWVMSHLIFKWVTLRWVMSHFQISHTTHTWAGVYMIHVYESCHIYKWVMSHFQMSHSQMSHVTLSNKSHHTYLSWCIHYSCVRVMAHLQMSHVTLSNKSCHTYMSCAFLPGPYVTFANESCHIYKWVMSHFQISHATHTL